MEFQSETTVSEILRDCLKIELAKHDRILQMRVAECLKRIGWVKCEKKKISGKVLQMWRWQPEEGKVATESENRSNSDTANNTATDINELSSKVATNIATSSNPDTASNTAKRLPPLPPFSEISDSEEKKINKFAHKNQNHKVDDSKNVVPVNTSGKTVATFKDDDEVEFFCETDKQWHKGRIASIETESGYFVKAVIKYWAFKKSRQQVICREDWLRQIK